MNPLHVFVFFGHPITKGECHLVNEDTIQLLHECNAGVKMGIASIDEVINKVQNPQFQSVLGKCKEVHSNFDEEVKQLLAQNGEEGKEPTAMAKGMSKIMTNLKTAVEPGDETIADIITDGCNMGVKTLQRHLNEYKTADAQAKNITERLIQSEKKLAEEISVYL